MIPQAPLVVWFEKLGRGDVALVGGKNASLGEMVRHLGERGVRVPPGFATTAQSYWQFVDANGLRETMVDSLAALEAGHAPLAEVGAAIRREFLRGTWPPDIAEAIEAAYQELCRRAGKANTDVAVRSSATAEDLPDASFAGQQESYLNIRGEKALLVMRLQWLEHDRQQVAPQLPDNGHVKHIHREARPQLTAQQGEGGDVALHLPAGRDPPREIDFVGDDQYGRRFHV